ncbi:MAG: TlpA family protein disulfide reductase [Hyphomicrobium sp.]
MKRGDENSGGNERGRSSATAPAMWVIALSALIGFGAVYVMRGQPDNASSNAAVPAATAPDPALTAGTTANSGSTSTAPAATKSGQMAAFVKKAAPQALPDIAFNDGAGKPTSLSAFKGKVVLLNLWATWCAPCREEMPALDRLQAALGGDAFEVVALSLDRKGAEASQKFLDDVAAKNLKLYIDATAKQGTALKIVGMPTTILIDKDGREIGRLAGPAEWDSDDAKALIKAAMN